MSRGPAIAYTRLGRPDIGLVAMSEVADTVALIRDRVGSHLIVDADTGYGNALNVARTVRMFERAGANAIQIEDQDFPKRCGHLDNKTLIPAQEMVGKIKAALDSRHSRETLVIARTDAIAVEGFEPAMARAVSYRDAGADILFVEAPKTREELKRIPPALKGVPAHGQYGGGRQDAVAQDGGPAGARLFAGDFPGGIVRAVARTAGEFYESLAANGTSEPFRNRMHDFRGLNDVIGTPAMIALGKQYESGKKGGGQ